MKHFTLLEVGSEADSPMIGTINNVTEDKKGELSFIKRVLVAVGEHFDLEDFNHDSIPDVFHGEPNTSFGIEANGANYEIRILETWIY
tara:strand:+ start:192 stop:455 length:264 start_codon:yes stop_codon:yes gene_type:complete